jgi:hypothetical protein
VTLFLRKSSYDIFYMSAFPESECQLGLLAMLLIFMIFNCSPLIENPYKDAVEMNAFGGLSLDAFLSEVHKSFIFISSLLYFVQQCL